MRDYGVALLWSVCAGFALGVGVRSLVSVPDSFLLILLAIAIALVFAAASNARSLRMALCASALLVSFGFGVLRMQSAVFATDPHLASAVGQKIELQGIVADEPDARATQVRVPIQLDNSPAKILAVFPSHTELYYGEHIQISGTLQNPNSFDTGVGRQFNYPGYLASQGISYELDRASVLHGEGFAGNSLIAFAYRIKELFVEGLEQSLPEPQAGLAGGITVGDKRAMGKDLTKEFQTVSLIHVVVLSGYNITIVISALFALLSKAPRFVRFGSGGLVALFFAVMTGFASASVRAALMALIAISGSLSGRIYRPERALALVGALMLLWNPYLLVFDPGFQLSFLACAGLLVFSPSFEKLFESFPDAFGFKEILVSTSSAQLAVLPLLLFESGSLSLVSIPANLFALAAVPPAMLFSAAAALGGLHFETAAPVLGFPAHALLSYILFVAHVFASLPFASVSVPAFSAWLLVPVYGAIFGYGLLRAKNEGVKAQTKKPL